MTIFTLGVPFGTRPGGASLAHHEPAQGRTGLADEALRSYEARCSSPSLLIANPPNASDKVRARTRF